MIIMGQPNEVTQTIDNPLVVNDVLSFLIYGTTQAEVRGLDTFPRDQWPQPLPLLFYAYHIMVGLGTYFFAIMGLGVFMLWRNKLFTSPWGSLAADAQLPPPLHRHHRRVDDRRNRPPALGRLRSHAHLHRLLAERLCQQRPLLTPWLHGTLRRPQHPLHRAHLPRNPARPTR